MCGMVPSLAASSPASLGDSGGQLQEHEGGTSEGQEESGGRSLIPDKRSWIIDLLQHSKQVHLCMTPIQSRINHTYWGGGWREGKGQKEKSVLPGSSSGKQIRTELIFLSDGQSTVPFQQTRGVTPSTATRRLCLRSVLLSSLGAHRQFLSLLIQFPSPQQQD